MGDDMPTSSNTTSMLIINPNTTTEMTDALVPVANSLNLPNVTYTFFTCPPPGIPSINSPADAAKSADFCFPHLEPLVPTYDTFLVACYSHHPLVALLQTACTRATAIDHRPRHVTGIFEASVAASLDATSADKTGFGIVSTGKVWEAALADAVAGLLPHDDYQKFLGCETTGLNADELHRLPAAEVRGKMMEATKCVVGNGRERGRAVRAVCLGCAGMVGLEEAVKQALVEELGEDEAGKVAIVDGVKVGIQRLAALARRES